MSALRGFGFHMDIRGGTTRHWYAGADGVRRWADNDAPVDIPTPDPLSADEAEHETENGLFAGAMTPDEEAEQVNLRG